MGKDCAAARQPSNVGFSRRLRTEEGLTTFTDRGIECLQELLADIRTWEGGILEFLRAEQCEADVIERIMADEKNR
jgi:hypothetical protein